MRATCATCGDKLPTGNTELCNWCAAVETRRSTDRLPSPATATTPCSECGSPCSGNIESHNPGCSRSKIQTMTLVEAITSNSYDFASHVNKTAASSPEESRVVEPEELDAYRVEKLVEALGVAAFPIAKQLWDEITRLRTSLLRAQRRAEAAEKELASGIRIAKSEHELRLSAERYTKTLNAKLGSSEDRVAQLTEDCRLLNAEAIHQQQLILSWRSSLAEKVEALPRRDIHSVEGVFRCVDLPDVLRLLSSPSSSTPGLREEK